MVCREIAGVHRRAEGLDPRLRGKASEQARRDRAFGGERALAAAEQGRSHPPPAGTRLQGAHAAEEAEADEGEPRAEAEARRTEAHRQRQEAESQGAPSRLVSAAEG